MKKKNLRNIIALTTVAIMLTACGSSENNTANTTEQSSISAETEEQNTKTNAGVEAESEAVVYTEVVKEDMFTERDLSGEYEKIRAVRITLADNGTVCDSGNISIEDNKVTITEEGTYLISGELTEGMLIVDAEDTDKVQLVFENVKISNSSNAAIYVKSADKVFLTLAEGSTNRFFNGGSYAPLDDSNIDGVIFSKSDITINGSGSLEMEAVAGHGIVSKDDLKIAGGNLTIDTAGQGLSGKDSVRIAAGTIVIESEKDGIHSDNEEDETKGFVYIAGGNIQITAGVDGIDAVNFVQIDSGEVQIAAGDDGIHSDGTTAVRGGNLVITESYEGLEGKVVLISGGNIRIVSSDDGINAAGGNDQSGFGGAFGGDKFGGSSDASVQISGGSIYMDANGDGVDSNGSLIVTGGELYVSGPENGGNGALDYTTTGQAAGGTVVAVGNKGMAMNFDSSSTQGSILITTDNMSAGTRVIVKDASGTELICYEAESTFNSVLVTSPLLMVGNTYTVTVGDSDTEVTLENVIYGKGMSGFGGGRGDFGGHGGRPGAGNGQMPEGEKPDWGEMPQMPEGEMPDWGEMPQMPEGEMPDWGEMPQMPEGEMPDWGEMPQMPEGEMPDWGEMPQQLEGEKPDWGEKSQN